MSEVVRVLRAVKEFEDRLEAIVKSVERDASGLLAAADERVRRLEAEAEAFIEEVRGRIARAVEEEIRRAREELEKRRSEALARIDEVARANFEKAVRAVLEVLTSAIRV